MIIQPSSFEVPPGKMLGIIGPSGSGKTTLLQSLAQMEESNSITVGGDVNIRGSSVAFIEQGDCFFECLTVKETLKIAGTLQGWDGHSYGRTGGDSELATQLKQLGLCGLENRRVGGKASLFSRSHLSGGERRRLSFLLNTLGPCDLILADEPSSGLDSTQSLNVIRMLKKIGVGKMVPVLVSIHQPRERLFDMLDYVMVMSPGGRVVYCGEAASAIDYFKRGGWTPFQLYQKKKIKSLNTAEFLIDLVSINHEDPERQKEDVERIEELASNWKRNNLAIVNSPTTASSTNVQERPSRRPRFLKRFWTLFSRSLKQNFRNTDLNLLKIIGNVGTAYFFSILFQKSVGPRRPGDRISSSSSKFSIASKVPRLSSTSSTSSLQSSMSKKLAYSAGSLADRTALLSYAILSTCMQSLITSLGLFESERPVVTRERRRKQYSSAEYMTAKAVAELPLQFIFSWLFAGVLHSNCDLNISLPRLGSTLSLVGVASTMTGYMIGSLCQNNAVVAGVPILLAYITLGIINPSGQAGEQQQLSQLGLPFPLKILKDASPVRWGIESVLFNEFNDMKIERQSLKKLPRMGVYALIKDGKQVVKALGLGEGKHCEDDTADHANFNLVKVSCVNFLLAIFGLSTTGPKTMTTSNK